MKREQQGSALILVVIVTVLLSVVGIMFVMTMRMREMTTANIADDRDLDTAVGAVTEKIGTVLLQDLFGTNLTASILSTEAYDSTNSDPWLASLEPQTRTDSMGGPYNCWQQVTDLYNNNFGVPAGYYDPLVDTDNTYWNGSRPEQKVQPQAVQTKIITEGERVHVIRQGAADWSAVNLWYAGAGADADGDGVADSRWTVIPNLTTSRGKPVYAAVRIIDNCAMLNLNTSNCFRVNTYTIGTNTYTGWFNYRYPPDGSYYLYQDSTIIPQYYREGGRYLSETNYGLFLRGNDTNFPYRILAARKLAQLNAGGNLTLQLPVRDIHDVLMNIESSGAAYSFFDIGDELEIQNRFLLTSQTISRFENNNCAYNTFDFGRGEFVGGWNVDLRSKRIPCVTDTGKDNDLAMWRIRLDPANFDATSGGNPLYANYYDRRHLCTFYSFDRNIRSGSYMLLDAALNSLSVPASQKRSIENLFRPLDYRPIDLRTITDPVNPDNITADTPEARKNILHLLYAFREYYFDDIISEGAFSNPAQIKPLAAQKAAQVVANMIDYLDDPAATTGPFADILYGTQTSVNPTFINKAIIDAMIIDVSGNDPIVVGNAAFDFGLDATDTLYGYERQPFISEVYSNNSAMGVDAFAVELINPYDTPIDLDGWNIKVGTQNNPITTVAGNYVIPAGSAASPGMLTIYAGAVAPSGKSASHANFGLGYPSPMTGDPNGLRLQRPDPANSGQFITVDGITNDQRQHLLQTDAIWVTKREDVEAWGYTNKRAYVNDQVATLGLPNGVTASYKGYQLPVADTVAPLDRLADFQKIIFVGNGADPNCITSMIADAYTHDGESDIRFDYLSFPPMLKYVCTMNRSEEANLPGRININTAPKHVIAAAIPPQLVMTGVPISDPNYVDALTLAEDIAAISNRPYKDLGDLLTKIPAMKKYAVDPIADTGEQGIRGDFEERDWIINRLSNIFTVRSDTFTAYILVRLGTDGPQRRMIAIFDRSNCWTKDDKPRPVALHPVPDPR
jgi:hypothetical protein